MKKVFNNITDLSDFIYEEWAHSKDNQDVYVVGKYDDLIKVFNNLIKDEAFTMVNIQIEEEAYDNYDKEYILSIDDAGDIYVEKAYESDVYKCIECCTNIVPIIIAFSDVDKEFFGVNNKCQIINVHIGDAEEFECEAEMFNRKDGMCGISYSKNYGDSIVYESFYSTNPELVDWWAKNKIK